MKCHLPGTAWQKAWSRPSGSTRGWSVVMKMTPEVPSDEIGEIVMNHLRELDHIAYIRFASVYRAFADLEELQTELELNLASIASIPAELQTELEDAAQETHQALATPIDSEPDKTEPTDEPPSSQSEQEVG